MIVVKRKVLGNFLAMSMLLSLSACSTLFGDNERIVNINSTPPGAKVVVNNRALDNPTPTQISISDMFSPTIIMVERPGCKPQQVTIKPEFQGIGWLNILLWPGFVIDGVTGDMMRIPENQRSLNIGLCQQA